MEESSILQLVENIADSLAEMGLQVMDTRPFVQNFKQSYANYEELRQDIIKGKVSLFIELDAIIHEGAWDETGNC